MKKLRYVLIVAILLAVLIPFTVQAAGTFYCSASYSGDGSGTFANPWGCSTQQELDYVINTLICGRYGGGVLYRLFPTSYVFYDIVWSTDAGLHDPLPGRISWSPASHGCEPAGAVGRHTGCGWRSGDRRCGSGAAPQTGLANMSGKGFCLRLKVAGRIQDRLSGAPFHY